MKDLGLPKKRTIEIPVGLFKRFLGLIVDIFVINIAIIIPFSSKFSMPESIDTVAKATEYLNQNPQYMQSASKIFMMITVLAYLYFAIFDYKMNQTPGKMVTKMFVKNDIKKNPMKFSQALVRNLDKLILFTFTPLVIFDLGYTFFNKDKLRFFEKISKTSTKMKVEL